MLHRFDQSIGALSVLRGTPPRGDGTVSLSFGSLSLCTKPLPEKDANFCLWEGPASTFLCH